VLKALRDEGLELTVIVSISYDEDQAAEPEQRGTGQTVEDLRRSLEALSVEEGALLRAIRRTMTIERLGSQPLGNLVLGAVASALGDYSTASVWLGQQLGIAGAVWPATTQPLPREIETAEEASGASPSHALAHQIRRLRFTAGFAGSPAPAIAGIENAQWVLLAPGSLYESVLATAAVPDVVAALGRTRGRVLWIANLEPRPRQTANMSAIDHLRALTLHGVRVDGVLHDPSAPLRFDVSELEGRGVESIARALRSNRENSVHDPERLRTALKELIGSPARVPFGGRAPG
jgi:uncharacterized cofD-like protein